MTTPALHPSDVQSPWDLMQEPARPARLSPAYLLLLSALDSGWEVAAPVQVQPGDPAAYAFILRRPNSPEPRRLCIPRCREVERFVRDEGLTR